MIGKKSFAHTFALILTNLRSVTIFFVVNAQRISPIIPFILRLVVTMLHDGNGVTWLVVLYWNNISWHARLVLKSTMAILWPDRLVITGTPRWCDPIGGTYLKQYGAVVTGCYWLLLVVTVTVTVDSNCWYCPPRWCDLIGVTEEEVPPPLLAPPLIGLGQSRLFRP